MTQPFKNIIYELWRPSYERKGISQEFKPVFTRYIGLESQNDYPNLLATLKHKIEEHNALLFDTQIEMKADFDFINNIKAELSTLNVDNLQPSDIQMFEDPEYNSLYINNLKEIITLSKRENFPNDSVRNNFITKILLYTYLYAYKTPSPEPYKCVYYGDISKHDVYFLELLHRIGYDVLYINPLRDSESFYPDTLSVKHPQPQILPIETFNTKASQGRVIEQHNSITLGFEQQMEEELFTDSGLFRPWQFKNGTTTSILFNSTVIDLEQNWNADARMRQGFKVVDRNVHVPTFFYEIEGEDANFKEHQQLYSKLDGYVCKNLSDFMTNTLSETQILEIAFTMLGDGTFDIDGLKALSFYPYDKYNDDTENLILNKINETLKDDLILTPLDKNRKLYFVATILQLNQRIIRMIDNFDFPLAIPKIKLVLENENEVDENTALILAYLHKVGFDIIIYSPSGMSNLTSYIDRHRYNQRRLDKLVYDRNVSDYEVKGFWSKLLG